MSDDDVKVLSRSEFLASVNNMRRELVAVPELGGSVYVSELYAAQVLDFNAYIESLKGKGKKSVTPSMSIELMARLVSMTVCDANGKQLFTEADVKLLARSNLAVLITLSAKAMELSGMGNAAVNEVKEQLKKNQNKGSVTT